ncbi:hypothetical protein [Marinifilum caeruleilacunae]|uniref:Uncharacterized protein n=1 Tax=Marinifilum caeruleilacunae TaxID=2499076 RepID=A0ABX1X0E7_9BACT|nr:hypothetical protein [Marinifilum caeruleilacunae]NOU61837.1 hypothetical protein [Marinifilum caeruleilacunae]
MKYGIVKNSLVNRVLWLFFWICIGNGVLANPLTAKERDSLLNLPLFKNEHLLKIELKTDLTTLINDIAEKRDYHESDLLVLNEGAEQVQLSVKVKTRGNFRRRKQNCNFPPLRFKIPAREAKGTEFEGQSKLKYVSHCQSFIEDYEQHTIEEYLIYKMYNLVSDHSYRARLAQVSFIDTNTSDTIKKFGFFLEDKDDVALRNGKQILNYKNMKQYEILRENMVMLSLFQLMIGNADWDVGRLHNIDIMSVSDHSIPVVVPYDFDWSGIINHSYFTLSPKIAPDAKYKRLYKGMRWSQEELQQAFANFNELKPTFLELLNGCEYLKETNRYKLLGYIEEFYHLINTRKDVKEVIEKKAPKIPKTR